METTFYESGNVRVTNARFIVGEQTYPLGQITSVSLELVPAKHGCGTLLMVLGGLLGIALLVGGLIARDETAAYGVFFLVIAAAGYALNKAAKDRYAVKVTTAAGEQRALIHTEREVPAAVVDALNEALANRG